MTASFLAQRSVDCLPPDALAAKLALGRPLRVKLGVDPTAPDIHLGHTVVLGKLREFQDAGHIAVLIIGDWTARIGDPSGRTSTRPILSEDEIDANAETYRAQAFSILDPVRTEIRPNGEWFSQMGLGPLFELAGRATVNQILRRNDFAERLGADRPISMLEMLYPLMQAYDSVAVEADVELGGTDQLFNLMMGRAIQEAYGQPPQIVMTMPILPGTDGVRRMGKSLGNYIGVTEAPQEQFGKVMSVPDEAVPEFERLLFPTLTPEPDAHPGERKRALGRAIVARFHGTACAGEAEGHFNRVVRDRQAPADVPTIELEDETIHLPALLVDHLGVTSRSEARRLLAAGAVLVDDVAVRDLDMPLSALVGRVLRAGKRRFARIAKKSASSA